MEQNEPIRVAQIIGKWVGGGVEAVVMNYYRHIDHSKIQFDFFCDDDSTNIPYEEIEALGGKVILIPPYQNVFKYQKKLIGLLREGKYRVVHSHINTLSVFPLRAAKKAGIPVRIAHSHSTSNSKEWKKNLIKSILKPLAKIYSTDYFACTEHAGRWLFGNKTFEQGKVFIMNNAIEIEKFKYNEIVREQKRRELGIDKNTLVIGHIGRFVEQKNHDFLIDIFDEVHKKESNSILLLVGQGPLMENIKQKVEKLGITEAVKFLGQRIDVNDLYQVFDVFLFPSLYEGLGMVLIEAQASGLFCLASNEVPKITKITENIEFIGLNESIDVWKEYILNKQFIRKDYIEDIKNHGYDINIETIKLIDKYTSFNVIKKGKDNG